MSLIKQGSQRNTSAHILAGTALATGLWLVSTKKTTLAAGAISMGWRVCPRMWGKPAWQRKEVAGLYKLQANVLLVRCWCLLIGSTIFANSGRAGVGGDDRALERLASGSVTDNGCTSSLSA